MTDVETIQFLWRYMVHADQQMIAAIETLSDEGFAKEQAISFGSVQKLASHAIIAQSVWLRRLKGEAVVYADVPLPAKLEVRERWKPLHEQLLAFAQALTGAALEKRTQSRNRAGQEVELSARAIMLHVADHATYHRGQLNSMIKLAGGTPSPVMVYSYAILEGMGREL